jgi:hypothetical protein
LHVSIDAVDVLETESEIIWTIRVAMVCCVVVIYGYEFEIHSNAMPRSDIQESGRHYLWQPDASVICRARLALHLSRFSRGGQDKSPNRWLRRHCSHLPLLKELTRFREIDWYSNSVLQKPALAGAPDWREL